MKSVFGWILSLEQQKGSCRFTKIHSLKRQPLFIIIRIMKNFILFFKNKAHDTALRTFHLFLQ